MILSGIDPTQVWAATEIPGFRVGTLGADYQGNIYRFVQADANGVTGAGYVVVIEASNIVDMIDTGVTAPGAGQGFPVGVAMAAIAANGWGWVGVYGVIPTRVSTLCVLGTQLNSRATVGELDDDATAGSEVVNGIAAITTNSGGASANVNAFLSFPSVGRTL